jgi:predicted transcriptional regulator
MNYIKIQDLIHKKQLRKSNIAKMLGISYKTFSYYLNGKRDLTEEQKQKLINIVNK